MDVISPGIAVFYFSRFYHTTATRLVIVLYASLTPFNEQNPTHLNTVPDDPAG